MRPKYSRESRHTTLEPSALHFTLNAQEGGLANILNGKTWYTAGRLGIGEICSLPYPNTGPDAILDIGEG
jgi:hypothetical protein